MTEPKGVFRDNGWVAVDYPPSARFPIPQEYYEDRGYQPPHDKLPSKEEYEARNANRT